MNQHSAKRVAKVKLTLTKRTVEALKPDDKPWIAWDDKLVGFGCRVQPSGTKSFIVNYRAGEGGRKAPNKRVVVGRYDRIMPEQARRRAQELLGRVAGRGRPGWRADRGARPADAGRGLRRLHRVRPRPGGRDAALLAPLRQPLSRRLALAADRRHHPPRHREPLPSAHRAPRRGPGQPGPVIPALGLPPALRRP